MVKRFDHFEPHLSVDPNPRVYIFNGPLCSVSFEWWLYVLASLLSVAFFNNSVFALAGALAWLMFVHSTAAPPPFWTASMIWTAGFFAGWNWDLVRRASSSFLFVLASILCGSAIWVAGKDFAACIIAPYSGLFVLRAQIINPALSDIQVRSEAKLFSISRSNAINRASSTTAGSRPLSAASA